jgi:hypothetical protein
VVPGIVVGDRDVFIGRIFLILPVVVGFAPELFVVGPCSKSQLVV